MKTARSRTVLARRYLLEEELGRGGIGTVWRAIDLVLDRTVAVKVLSPHIAGRPAFARRVADEAGRAARLSHPGIARVLDIGEDDGSVFIVTEHIDGTSLRTILSREGRLDHDRAVAVLEQVLSALATAHREGVFHLDLKPENILVCDDGRVLLTDTGLAHAVDAAGAGRQTTSAFADPPYASPERRARSEPSEGDDVYAAGAVLFEALTGRPPGPARRADRTLPREAGSRIPRALDEAVVRALAARPGERFATAEAFADALAALHPARAASDSGERRAPGSVPPHPDAGSFFGSWMLVPILLAILVAGLIATGLALGRLQLGGPLGVEPKASESPRPEPAILPIRRVSTLDPFGDGTENDAGVAFATDGDAGTVWKSENYFDGRLNKPGVGLLLDLGAPRTVTGFRLLTPAPGFRFTVMVGDDPETIAESSGADFTAAAEMRETLEAAESRYVLLWITSVVDTGDGNRAEVAEFEVTSSDG